MQVIYFNTKNNENPKSEQIFGDVMHLIRSVICFSCVPVTKHSFDSEVGWTSVDYLDLFRSNKNQWLLTHKKRQIRHSLLSSTTQSSLLVLNCQTLKYSYLNMMLL
jgi:hypothetical protein